jgi:ArsR family transcriptional regulator
MSKSLKVLSAATCCAPLAEEPLGAGEAAALAQVFKALGDPVRLQLLGLILASADREACVCDLNAAFELSQPTISHHLKVLHDAGLLEREKRGVWVHYRASTSALDTLAGFLQQPAGRVSY